MPSRWAVLGVLFFARLMMAFQYQSVGALSPVLVETLGVSLAEIGLLIGLYLGPGVIIAIPGGSLAARFGDVRVVGGSLGLMLAGGLLSAFGTSEGALILGRVIAGIGGVAINVVMTKMLVDWFAGREIATAMGVFIASWPAGIALALLVLPPLAGLGGLVLAHTGMLVLIAAALAAFLAIYRPAAAEGDDTTLARRPPLPMAPLLWAGSLWALYNTALVMVFGFGPLVLVGQGLSPTAASSVVSAFTLAVGIAVPLGGFLADRTGRRDAVIGLSIAASTLLMSGMLAIPPAIAPAFYAIGGLVFGLAAGQIVALPSEVLEPRARAVGMGIFYSVYYGLMLVGPALAGLAADAGGDPGVALVMGAAMLVACLAALVLFRRSVGGVAA